MYFRQIQLLILVTLGSPCVCVAQQHKPAGSPRVPVGENALAATKKGGGVKGTASSGTKGSLALPTWKDTLIRSDVQLLPAASQRETAGYFPTQSDIDLLGDRDYPRRAGYQDNGPDAVLQNATGIFPYQSGEQNYYTRNADCFRPLNRVLGMFTPQQALTYEPDIFPGLAVSIDGALPSIFTRTFEPSKAHVKAGPLAFDLLWIGGGAIWSDYKGPSNNFPPGQGDGLVSYIDFALRGYLRLTDSLYFSWAANLIYLPGSNELGFRTLNGGWPQLGAEFFYQKRIKGWDIYIADEFFARPGLDMFADLELRGQDQAGRYMFGNYGRTNRTGLYDSRNVFFVNQATIQTTTMAGASNWRFWADYQHTDFWHTFDFDNYQMRDTWEAALAYEGNAIPFAPRLSYQLTAFDGYNSLFHQIQCQFRGRLTENVTLQTMIGYLWTGSIRPSRDDLLWSVNLDHRFSVKGTHGVQVGQQLLTDSYTPDSVFAAYYRYHVNYQLLKRLNVSAFAQYSHGDRINSANNTNIAFSRNDVDNCLVGTSLELQLFDFTRIVGMSAFERADGDAGFPRTDRWIHRVQLLQQLASRLTMECGYQYETFIANPGFSEHLINFGIRRYF